MKQSILASTTLILVLSAAASLAHTSVSSTSPKSGSVLERSPPLIEIQFREAASLTSVVVTQVGKRERRLEFSPKGSATSFKVSNPALEIGRNEIQWKALSMDGHVISGTLILTIKPTNKPAS